ncbi:MAG: M15 family metallopeptidase [Succinivibrionaceae bacterium]
MTDLTTANLSGQSETHLVDVPEFPGCRLTAGTAKAFLAMAKAAEQDGIRLTPVSSFRSFDRQLQIWNDKYMGDRDVLDNYGRKLDISRLTGVEAVYAILFWSALPGMSRHHWGTDLDVMAENLLPEDYKLKLVPGEYATDGIFAPLTSWLDEHMEEYGFFRPFTDEAHVRVGTELWHISYRPDAAKFEKLITIDTITQLLKNSPIAGKSCLLGMVDELYEDYIIHA